MHKGGYKLGRRPALDGLRAVAVLAVIASHATVPLMAGAGTVGVTVFFVLSGFLITQLLLEERHGRGRIDLRAFYLRRLRRLSPALVVFLTVVSVMMAAARVPLWPVLTALTYTSDLRSYVSDRTVAGGSTYFMLGHTWSLSLEEQFYLLWPLVLIWFGRVRPRALAPAIGLTIGLVTVNRAVLVLEGEPLPRVLFAPDARVDALLAGCLLAVLMRHVAGRRLGPAAILGSLVLVGCFPFGLHEIVLLLLPITVASVAVVAWAATCTTGGLLGSRPALGLGRISYGMYLWHYPTAIVMVAFGVPWWANFLATVTVSLSVASLSRRCIELPFVSARSPSLRGGAASAVGA